MRVHYINIQCRVFGEKTLPINNEHYSLNEIAEDLSWWIIYPGSILFENTNM
jgi:hypothetical protein